MNYGEMLDKVFAHVAADDGYNGHTITLGIAFDEESGKLVEVHDGGCHPSAVLPMDIADLPEAKWLVKNHPQAKKYYQILPHSSNLQPDTRTLEDYPFGAVWNGLQNSYLQIQSAHTLNLIPEDIRDRASLAIREVQQALRDTEREHCNT